MTGIIFFISSGVYAQRLRTSPTPLPSNEWSRVSDPTEGAPNSIGFYSAGCLAGARTLPLDGVGYQVMKVFRNRYYGHSSLIEFITRLGRSLDSAQEAMLIGDMAQPRGGPLPYGHASHQIGLDVDIWYWTHPDQRIRSLTLDERNNTDMKTVLTPKGTVDPTLFTEATVSKLKFAATDPMVERIFVNPAIKKYLCAKLPASEHTWLHTLRPWPGHDNHFHVRLVCNSDSPQCVPQDPQSGGDGCSEVGVATEKNQDAEPESKIPPKVEELLSHSELPAVCRKILKQ